MNCGDARTAFFERGDTPEVRAHSSECAECRHVLDGLDIHRQLLGEDAVWAVPPDGLADRVSRLIAGASAPHESGPARRWWRGLAAACVALILGLATWATVSSADWEDVMVGTLSSRRIEATVSGWSSPSGTRLVVDASELEPAPEGFTYEMWLSNGRVALSAGSFRGGEPVGMFIGARRADYPRLWVTLEPLDNDQSPSGVIVADSG